MKKQLFQCMCVLSLALLPLVAHGRGRYVNLDECSQIIPFQSMTSEMSQQLSLGEIPNVALEIEKGMEFPATLLAKIGFVSMVQDSQLKITVERTCYFRFFKLDNALVRAYMSFDLVNWKKAGKFKEGELIFNVDKNQLQVLIDVPEPVEEVSNE